jgi:hypothetical protein
MILNAALLEETSAELTAPGSGPRRFLLATPAALRIIPASLNLVGAVGHRNDDDSIRSGQNSVSQMPAVATTAQDAPAVLHGRWRCCGRCWCCAPHVVAVRRTLVASFDWLKRRGTDRVVGHRQVNRLPKLYS